MAAVRALWLTPALLGSALALAVPSAAAPSKAPRWKYDVNFVEGEATFTWSGVGVDGDTSWDGTAKVTFFSGALKGTGFLDLGLGGGTVRIKVTTTWTENYRACRQLNADCEPPVVPCEIAQQRRTEPGGLSLKIVGRGTGAVVRYTWNLPQAEPVCSAGSFWPPELGELKAKQGKMTQSAPLSTFAKRQIRLTLDGSDGYRGANSLGSFIGTYTWHAVVLLKRK